MAVEDHRRGVSTLSSVRPLNNGFFEFMPRREWATVALVAAVAVSSQLALAQHARPSSPPRLSSPDQYQRYIDPLVKVDDFGTAYYEDGAADATVLFAQSNKPPYDYQRPAAPVIELVRLRDRGFPLLIDCLSDGRLTRMRFGGNSITKPMNVPVSYVCLDILIGELPEKPISIPDCADDGLGACVNSEYYFRPDDYYRCSDLQCFLRPWIIVVQRKWRSLYLAHQLRFHNPFDILPVDQYKEFRTTPK
jgi:hypothetical protein